MLRNRKDDPDFIDIIPHDLRALLFWACIGIAKSKGGAYEDEIEHIIESWNQDVGATLPCKAEFGALTIARGNHE